MATMSGWGPNHVFDWQSSCSTINLHGDTSERTIGLLNAMLDRLTSWRNYRLKIINGNVWWIHKKHPTNRIEFPLHESVDVDELVDHQHLKLHKNRNKLINPCVHDDVAKYGVDLIINEP